MLFTVRVINKGEGCLERLQRFHPKDAQTPNGHSPVQPALPDPT